MGRIWVIAPYDSSVTEAFDTAWDYDLRHSTIALGWRDLGNVSSLSRNELDAAYRKTFPHQKAKGVITRDVNALWAFYHEIRKGDTVVARRGRKRILAIGQVVGESFYDESKGCERVGGRAELAYANFLPVAWDEKAIDFDQQVFSFYTIYEIPQSKLDGLLELRPGPEPEQEFEESELPQSETEFALEKYLEDFIVSNFDKIFCGQLSLFKDPDGNPAQQFPTLNTEGKIFGRIDILAIDATTNDFVVIELKKGKESDPVVGQTLRYMGWVKENLCDTGQSVRGLIVAKDRDERLNYALQAVGDRVKFKKYKIDFDLVDP